MHWSAPFIGLPWRDRGRAADGVDCYGLVCLVFSRILSVELASFAEAYVSADEREEVDALIAGNAERWPWATVAPGQERPFDVALFRRGRLQTHVGIVIGRGRMLHINEGQTSCIEPYDGGRWELRLVGFYHHARVELADGI